MVSGLSLLFVFLLWDWDFHSLYVTRISKGTLSYSPKPPYTIVIPLLTIDGMIGWVKKGSISEVIQILEGVQGLN